MRRMPALVLFAAMAVAIAACNAAASASPSASAAASGGGAGAAAPELVGTAWALGDLPGQVLNDVRPTIAFSGDGTVSGSGGCNDFSGNYTVDGSKLTLGPLAWKQKACGDAVANVG